MGGLYLALSPRNRLGCLVSGWMSGFIGGWLVVPFGLLVGVFNPRLWVFLTSLVLTGLSHLDPIALILWWSGRSIHDRLVHSVDHLGLGTMYLTLSYAVLVLCRLAPLTFGGESGYEGVPSLVFCVFLGETSSYSLALNCACPLSDLSCWSWFFGWFGCFCCF